MAINVLVKIYTKSKAKVISMYYLRCTLPTEDAMALGNECISKDIHKNLNKKSSHVLIKVYIFALRRLWIQGNKYRKEGDGSFYV